MDRRSYLKTAAATIAVIIPGSIAGCVPPVFASEVTDAQIASLFAEWRGARASYEAAQERFHEADDGCMRAGQGTAAKGMAEARRHAAMLAEQDAYGRVSPLVQKLSAAVPTTAAGALAILEMLAVEFDGYEVPNLARIVANLRPALSAEIETLARVCT
nr:hypothetical protein [Methylobacterium sp. ZNC0032]